jgi:hypothetical protein
MAQEPKSESLVSIVKGTVSYEPPESEAAEHSRLKREEMTHRFELNQKRLQSNLATFVFLVIFIGGIVALAVPGLPTTLVDIARIAVPSVVSGVVGYLFGRKSS